jgi:hypothetical protein
MYVTFRCKRSGNTVSFNLDHDIQGMRKHEGYEEVKDEIKAESPTEESNIKESYIDYSGESKNGNERENERKDEGKKDAVLKKRGRPAKK